MSDRVIRLGFVGSGSWARRYHFPALAYLRDQPGKGFELRLHGITSLDSAQARAVAAQVGFGCVYPDLDALLADPALDAIAVAVTPEAAHGVLERVSARRLPIFSEKPPGVSATQAAHLAQIIAAPNVVAFNRRYIPLNSRFKAIVDAMDDIYFVEGHFLRFQRPDVTFMIGTGIHWINFIEYVLGEIAEVEMERFRDPADAAWARVARLGFRCGLRGLLKVLPMTGSDLERLEVHSVTQSVYLEGPLWADSGRIVIERGREREVLLPQAALGEVGDTPVSRGIVGEYQDFFSAILDGTPTRSTFQNAVNSMRIAELMEYSEPRS
jgi:predicted dehydrogenase